jgi:hypothetical protein
MKSEYLKGEDITLAGMKPAWCLFVACVAIFGAFLLAPRAVLGQEITGEITGAITDPSGAALPNASVTATDVLTGVVWPTKTNSAGVYDFPRLAIGRYSLKVSARGFKTVMRAAFELQMNQIARVNITLTVGAITQTVTVSGAPPLIQTDTMQVGLVTNSNFNENLPLATKNFLELTELAPGVTTTVQGGFNGAGTIGSTQPNVNGNREQDDNYLINGIAANETINNEVEYEPNPDAIQEFNMITNNAPAQYGQFEGGVISVGIKSGTDQYHGDAYEYYRNAAMDANSWANDWSGLPKAGYNYNMFGATFGGPVPIPKMRHKLFFFVDYEGLRDDTPPSTVYWDAYTPAERAGDFSQLLAITPYNPTPRQLYNPCASFSGPCTETANPEAVRQPFVDDMIPESMISPVAAKLFSSSFYPEPNISSTSLYDNATEVTHSYLNRDQGDLKIDYSPNSTNHIWGSYSEAFQSNPGTCSLPLCGESYDNNPFHLGVIDWTHTFSPTVLLDLRMGLNREDWTTGGNISASAGDFAETLGIADGNPNGPGLPSMAGGLYASSVGDDGIIQVFADTTWQPTADLYISRGHHQIHAGIQVLREDINSYYSGNNGAYGFMNYSGQYTAGPNPTNLSLAGSSDGAGEGDFFLGLPNEVGLGITAGTWGQRSTVLGPYVQDLWRATSKLTLNVGLRWEYNEPWVEVFNRQANFGLISGTEYLAGKTPCPYNDCSALYNNYWNDWEPRFGFAYDLGRGTVVRGAYTVSSYLEGTGSNLRLPLNPPYQTEYLALYDSGTQEYYPGSTTSQGFSTLKLPSDPFSGATLRVWNPDIKPAIVEQWNFGVEHQFPSQMLLSVEYVGQHGTDLMVPMDYYQLRLPGIAGCPSTDTSPCASPYLSGNPTLSSEIGDIVGTQTTGLQAYDALQVSLTKHMTQGLQFQLSGTWSKVMTNSIGYYGQGGQDCGPGAYWQDVYNMGAQWGPAEFDAGYTFSAGYVYNLPFGRGLHFATHLNPVANAFLGGWKTSGIVTYNSGFPTNVGANDVSGTDSLGPQANCIAPVTYPHGVGLGTTWFSPSSFAQPVAGTFGNCGIDTVWGPNLIDWDAGLMKDFRLGKSESRRLELRGEFINFTNTPEFSGPLGYVDSTENGVITGAGNSRVIQIGAKFYF